MGQVTNAENVYKQFMSILLLQHTRVRLGSTAKTVSSRTGACTDRKRILMTGNAIAVGQPVQAIRRNARIVPVGNTNSTPVTITTAELVKKWICISTILLLKSSMILLVLPGRCRKLTALKYGIIVPRSEGPTGPCNV